MNLGLRGRILLIATVLVMVATGSIALVTSYHFNKRITEAHASRSDAIARGLAVQLDRILALGLRITELQGFEEQCLETVRSNPGLSHAMVALPDGQVLFHSDPARMRTRIDSTAIRELLKAGAGSIDDAGERSHLAFAAAREAGADHVATVVVGFPLEMIEAERRNLLQLTVAIGAVATVVVLMLLFAALSQQVTQPLSRLVRAIEALRSGKTDLAARLPADRRDELGVMVQGFNGLLDRIAEREAQLVAARDAAEAASKAKSDFLAVISHEIRTPMNAMLGMTELLLRTDLTERQRLFASRSLGAGKTLMVLLNDILDFSRIEAGKLEIVADPFELRRVVQDTVDLFVESAAQKQLALNVMVDPTLPQRCVGDYVRLAQILRNLVSNAVKFTSKGTVQVTVMPMGEHIRFSVSDTGIGIDPGFLKHIYEAFTQADGTSTRRYGGTGLGLAIVKSLTDRLGGGVGVQSTPGRGTTFWVDLVLPAQVEDPPGAGPAEAGAGYAPGIASANDRSMAEKATPRAGSGQQPVRLLLVEDSVENQELVVAFLQNTPWSVALADNGPQAYEFFQREHFDLVLMDWSLPGMDGVQTTRAMRQYEADHGWSRTPIIAVTARVMAGDRQTCLEAGMDEYLSKPFTREDLIGMLGRFVRVGAMAQGEDDQSARRAVLRVEK